MDFDEWLPVGGPRLLRFAVLVTGDPIGAQDVVQDVLISAYLKWDKISRANNIDAYLKRMIVNRRNALSRLKRSGEIPLANIPSGDEQSPLQDASEDLWETCLTLPERQRAAIVLRYYEDLSFAQIAAVLDCAEATARSLVYRGLGKLRGPTERADWT